MCVFEEGVKVCVCLMKGCRCLCVFEEGVKVCMCV